VMFGSLRPPLWSCAQVLLVGAARHPRDREHQGRDGGGGKTALELKLLRNKCAPPFRQCEFDIMYGRGISREGSLLDMGVELGISRSRGPGFTYDGEQLGQGREKAKEFLAANPEVMVDSPEGEKSDRRCSRGTDRWPTVDHDSGFAARTPWPSPGPARAARRRR